MALSNLILEKNELTETRANAIARHAEHIKKIDKRLCDLAGLIESEKLGFDSDRIERAKGLVRVGAVNTRKRQECVDRFVKYLTENPKWLESNYCGVKVYSGFGEQHEDHQLGYGPRHGSIVFRVDMIKPSFSESEREDVLWYLLNIEKIQEAEKVATDG